MKAAPSRVYEFGDFRLNVARRLLGRRDGAAVPLTPKAFETLLYLVEHGGAVLDKEVLMEALWPDSIVEENNLSQNISTLRRVLGENPGAHCFIVTVPGRGYRFVADVTTREVSESEEIRETAVRPVAASGASAAGIAPSDRPAGRRKLQPLLLAALVLLAFSIAAIFVWRSTRFRSPDVLPASESSANTATPEKSIAVLPFENFSADKENAFFADGIQDDILTSLGKISDLKVISRMSASQYRGAGAARNLREVASALGVEHVLEGSVRRDGNRVLVNVQLIDARNDRHIWTEHYDRTITDSIGLQGELASEIAAALRAKLAPEEKARLEAKPTENPEAYALYLKALGREGAVNRSTEDLVAAEELYGKAIALDPKFALACARLSIVNSYHGGWASDNNRALNAKARVAAEEALRLSPSLGEAHMALGLCLYWAEKDYPAALKEFSIAEKTSPNEPDILQYIGGIYRRQGRWRESLAAYDRAQELDPRNLEVVTRVALDHVLVRDWVGATAGYNRALEIAPDSAPARIGLAYLEVFRNSNPAAGRKILQKIPANVDPNGSVTLARWDLAMLERDYATAEKILTEFPLEDFPLAGGAPKTYYQGRIALARDDIESAQRYFAAATAAMEGWARDDPDDAERHAQLGLLYAYMQRKENAIQEARRAIELEPESQNAFHGAGRTGNLALAYALTGEANQAITLLERLLITPGTVDWPSFLQKSNYAQSITLADLRLRWEWDSLRKDPRFQKILAGPEPKTIY
jgi:TolB-like protein/DNA-binding winged helix-turn-helix (wHTH) protein/Flp pilus assembly protein TadD